MTALESADEIEAVTAITFLLSLVIKRYSVHVTLNRATGSQLYNNIVSVFSWFVFNCILFFFCSVPDAILKAKFSKSCQVLVKILAAHASDGAPGLLRPVSFLIIL